MARLHGGRESAARHVPGVGDQQVPKRGVHVTRPQSTRNERLEPHSRSAGACVSEGNQVHLPQVRSKWLNPATRCALRNGPQYNPREDLHSALVLAAFPFHRLLIGCDMAGNFVFPVPPVAAVQRDDVPSREQRQVQPVQRHQGGQRLRVR